MAYKIINKQGEKVNTSNFATKAKAKQWIDNMAKKGFHMSKDIKIVPVKKRN